MRVRFNKNAKCAKEKGDTGQRHSAGWESKCILYPRDVCSMIPMGFSGHSARWASLQDWFLSLFLRVCVWIVRGAWVYYRECSLLAIGLLLSRRVAHTHYSYLLSTRVPPSMVMVWHVFLSRMRLHGSCKDHWSRFILSCDTCDQKEAFPFFLFHLFMHLQSKTAVDLRE